MHTSDPESTASINDAWKWSSLRQHIRKYKTAERLWCSRASKNDTLYCMFNDFHCNDAIINDRHGKQTAPVWTDLLPVRHVTVDDAEKKKRKHQK